MLEEEELGLRRKLWQAVYNEVERRTKLPFGDGYDEEYILQSFPYRIYYRTFGNLTGDVHEPILTLRIDGNKLNEQGATIARCNDTNTMKDIEALYSHGEDEFQHLPVATQLAEAYQKAKELTASLHAYVDDLTQSTTLPRNSRCHRCPD